MKVYIWALFILGVFISGCSRPEADVTKVSISVPGGSNSSQKVSAFSSEDLVHLIINVTGESLDEPIFISWSGRGTSGSILPAPESHEVTVPTGKKRLFQVLAVYAESGTGGLRFYYGDLTKDLSGGSAAIPINVTNVGADGAFTGSFSGRYLTSANQGPTGKILIKYKAPGKPALVVEQAQMVNGWFEAMGLYGASLEYTLENGTRLFDGNLIDLKTLSTSSRISKVVIPRHDANRMANPMNDWVVQEPRAIVYGWFAPSANSSLVTSKRICRADALGTLQNLASPEAMAAGSIRSNMLSVTTSAPAALASLISSPIGTPVSIQGGVTRTSDSSCSNSSNLFKDYLNFENSLMLDSYGSYRSKVFANVFEMRGIGRAVDLDFNTPTIGKVRFTVRPLPGVESKIDSLVLLKTSNAEALAFHEDDISCDRALTGEHGYTEVDSKIHLSYSEAQLTADMNYSSRLSSAFLICAKKNGKAVSAGIVIPADHFASFPVPISFSAVNSQVTTSASTVPVTGSVSVTVDLKGTDNNPYFEPVSSATLNFSGCTSGVTAGLFSQVGSTLVFSVTGVTQGSSCSISAVVDGETVSGGGATLQVLPPAPALSLANSAITSSVSQIASGSSLTVTLTIKDQYNAAFTGTVGSVAFEMRSGPCTGTFGAPNNVGGGVHTVQFTGVLKGSCSIIARIGGSLITNWVPITVTYGPFDISTSTFNPAPGYATNLSQGSVIFVPRDAAGNTIGEAVSGLYFSIDDGTYGSPGSGYYDAGMQAYIVPVSWAAEGVANITAYFGMTLLASTVPFYFGPWQSSM